MYFTVDLALNLLTSRPFVYELEDLPAHPEGVGRLDACKPPPTLPSTLIRRIIKEGLHHLGRILSYIFTVPLARVRSAIRRQKGIRMRVGYMPTELSLDHVKEVETIFSIVLIFILGFVGVILLTEVVLWHMRVVLSSDPHQICLVASVDSVINVRQLGLDVGLLLRILLSKQFSGSDPSLLSDEEGFGFV
jgi:hypothetical protein